MLSKKIAIDLGTANILVHLEGKGVIANEPSVVAVSDDNRIVAIGQQAKDMLGRTPDLIVAHRPMQDGAIADYRVTEAMLRYFIDKALGKVRLIRPEVMVSVPAGITSTERRAVIDATRSAGAKEAYLIQEPLAAAIGANIPIADPVGNMIIDIGGGTTEVAVISLGGIVVSSSIRIGGNRFDQSIADYIRRRHNLSVGDSTAEEAKIKIGSAMPLKVPQTLNIRGRDLVSGLPKVITITTNEIADALKDELDKIILVVKQVLEKTPPELSADILDHGIAMTGGSALLKNLDQLIAGHTGVPCFVVEEPMLCVVRGIAMALEHLPAFKRSVIGRK